MCENTSNFKVEINVLGAVSGRMVDVDQLLGDLEPEPVYGKVSAAGKLFLLLHACL